MFKHWLPIQKEKKYEIEIFTNLKVYWIFFPPWGGDGGLAAGLRNKIYFCSKEDLYDSGQDTPEK